MWLDPPGGFPGDQSFRNRVRPKTRPRAPADLPRGLPERTSPSGRRGAPEERVGGEPSDDILVSLGPGVRLDRHHGVLLDEEPGTFLHRHLVAPLRDIRV